MIAYRVIKSDVWYFAAGGCVMRADSCEVGRAFELLKVKDAKTTHGAEVDVVILRCDSNPYRDEKGRYTTGPNRYARNTRANVLYVKNWKNSRVKYEHIQKHIVKQKEYSDAKQYLARAIELAEMPVGGNIIGYKRKDGQSFVRYDKSTNEYVIAKTGWYGGIITLFKPIEKEDYYNWRKGEDGC